MNIAAWLSLGQAKPSAAPLGMRSQLQVMKRTAGSSMVAALVNIPRWCCCAGELLMAVRQYTSNLHDRDKLMSVAIEGIGSMPMAAIERCRHERR